MLWKFAAWCPPSTGWILARVASEDAALKLARLLNLR